jgi:hypothetical protein
MRARWWLVPIMAFVLAGCGALNSLIPPIEIGGAWFNDGLETGTTSVNIASPSIPNVPGLNLNGVKIISGNLVEILEFGSATASDNGCGITRLELTLKIAPTGGTLNTFFAGRVDVDDTTCILKSETLTVVTKNFATLKGALESPRVDVAATLKVFRGEVEAQESFELQFDSIQLLVGL